MPAQVHSLHVFDRKGRTLFTKRYVASKEGEQQDESLLAEQRKLVFGMLFSLREIASALTPEDSKDGGLHSVRTAACTLYNYETASGLRFALYVTDDSSMHATSIRNALSFVYNELWIQYVTRSPLFRPAEPNVAATSFEQKLDAYLSTQPWFR